MFCKRNENHAFKLVVPVDHLIGTKLFPKVTANPAFGSFISKYSCELPSCGDGFLICSFSFCFLMEKVLRRIVGIPVFFFDDTVSESLLTYADEHRYCKYFQHLRISRLPRHSQFEKLVLYIWHLTGPICGAGFPGTWERILKGFWYFYSLLWFDSARRV